MSLPAATALTRALPVNFVNFSGLLAVEMLESRGWASVTFSGERQRLKLRLEGPDARAAADAFLDGLGEREFDLRDHILVDIACIGEAIEGEALVLTLEALTIEAD